MKTEEVRPHRENGVRRGAMGALILLLLAGPVGSACSTHPGYQARIKEMNRVIDEGGYEIRGRPDNEERFREETQTIRE